MKENIEKVPPITSYGECIQPDVICALRNEKGECKDTYSRDEYCIDPPVFVVSSKFCGDLYIDAAFSTRQKAEDFITEREMSSASITELTMDKPSQDVYELPFRPTQRPEERVNHHEHYQHPSGVECITIARHHDFNIGNALKYLFRAGLKQEQGISPLDKQIEDLQKAVFYIQDEIKFLQAKQQEQ